MVKFNQIKERIKSEFLHLESKSDQIEFHILNMSQYFDHNFQLKYRIKVIPVALEISFKILQIMLKYDFPISDSRYAKISPQEKEANLDKSYSDLYMDCFLI
jgi:hypothetical protein